MESSYVKRTQKDYILNFRLQVVKEIELGHLTKAQAKEKYGMQGDSTITKWLQKFGNFDWESKSSIVMKKSPEQKLLELEAKVLLLEKQKKELEHRNYISDQKSIIFDMMINIAEREYKIDIRKNLEAAQSKSIEQKKNKK
jgi:transposase